MNTVIRDKKKCSTSLEGILEGKIYLSVGLEENTINVNIIAAIRITLSSHEFAFLISNLDSASHKH